MDCSKCTQIESCNRRLKALENKAEDFEKRITGTERNQDVSNEQIKMIYRIVYEIKEDTKLLGAKIDQLMNKPGENYNQLKLAAIISIVTGAIGVLIGKLF